LTVSLSKLDFSIHGRFYDSHILVFATHDVVNGDDSALVAENMILAAHSLGVGICWIGLALGLGGYEEFLKEQ
jgi:nitroreductase